MKRFIITILFFTVSYINFAQWSTSGNASTTSSNFIGTTNSSSLLFKVNNQVSGFIDGNFSTRNCSFGYHSLFSNVSTDNTANGYTSLYANTSGSHNVAHGFQSLFSNTSGYDNIAMGTSALLYNTFQYQSIGVGSNALLAPGNNIYAYGNIGIGYYATAATDIVQGGNTGIGSKALKTVGAEGHYSTAVGYEAAIQTVGTTAQGYQSSGLDDPFQFSNFSTSQGYQSCLYNGASITAIGYQSLYNSTQGILRYNVGIGSRSLYNITGGENNTALGANTLNNVSTGTYNTALGYNADINNSSLTNVTVIGYNTIGTASNQVRIGNSSVSSIGGFVNWSNISDRRVKLNIRENVPGLSFLTLLTPLTYNINSRKIDNFIGAKQAENIIGNKGQIYSGFSAQDVLKNLKKNGILNSSLVKEPKNDKDIFSLNYSEFVVPLVRAMQEINSKSNDVNKQIINIEELNSTSEKQIGNLLKEVTKLKPTSNQTEK